MASRKTQNPNRAGKPWDLRDRVTTRMSVASPQREMLQFGVLFAVLALILTGITASEFAQRNLHRPLSRLLAQVTGTILSPLGPTSVDGSILGFRDFGMEFVDACDGVLPASIYIAAVLAFPSRWRAKCWGLALGVPAIFLINLTRVVSLMILGAWRLDLFERVHIYVWQALVVGFSMAIWIFWAEHFVRPRPVARS